MARRPREHGWRDPHGITHHIDTRKAYAYKSETRSASCGTYLHNAARVRPDLVDCMACIAVVTRRDRLPPRPPPPAWPASWWLEDGSRHGMDPNRTWVSACGISLRVARASSNPTNCVACGANPPETRTRRRPERTADLGRRSR
jgi:hypothetical protein